MANSCQFSAALVFYEKETGKFYGVMRMEPGPESKVSCKPFIDAQSSVQEAALEPIISASSETTLKSSGAQHFVSTHAWQILNAFTTNYGL